MERMTARIEEGSLKGTAVLPKLLTDEDEAICQAIYRLADYEDTGLTPEQIHGICCQLDSLVNEVSGNKELGCTLCNSNALRDVTILDNRLAFVGGNSKNNNPINHCPGCGKMITASNYYHVVKK